MAGDLNGDGSAKYQFVVVAIVACGVFAAGVITIMYRRRRQQIYVERMGLGGFQGNTRLLMSDSGVLVEVPTRRTHTHAQPRKKRPKLGPEPKLWDVEVGECVADARDVSATPEPEAEDSDADSFESSIDEGTPIKGKSVAKLDVDEWQVSALACWAVGRGACRGAVVPPKRRRGVFVWDRCPEPTLRYRSAAPGCLEIAYAPGAGVEALPLVHRTARDYAESS